ncbi:MAG: 4-hydroxy-tetrahydrodipicolinate synthase [Gemmataceae bacterium]|nr:4-hydroxy-tetrahydrodipicolinate synthase [Gemmataceae bacterium]
MSLNAEQLRGTCTALVTPFDDSAEHIDEASFHRLIDQQIQAKVSGLVVCGSTGEACCLSLAEYERAIGLVKDRVAGRVPIIAGLSLSSTACAVDAGRIARGAGADALLMAAPPYNKPSQEGIFRHTRAVAEATGLPIIAYNIPGRSAVGMSPATIARMAEAGFVIGAKDSTGSLDSVLDLLAVAPPGLRVLSGEDSLVWPIMSCGGFGTISASANVAPDRFVALTDAALAGDIPKARRLQLELLPLIRALFLESNPGPAKAALWLQGVIASPAVRMPLLRAGDATIARLKELLSV